MRGARFIKIFKLVAWVIVLIGVAVGIYLIVIADVPPCAPAPPPGSDVKKCW